MARIDVAATLAVDRPHRFAAAAKTRLPEASEDDRRLVLHRFPDRDVRVVPNGVPGTPVPRVGRPGVLPDPVLLFVGHLGYQPNIHAVERLVEGVVPALRSLGLAPRVLVAGRRPSREFHRRLRVAGATVVADPPDVSTVYARADFAVVPLVHGGGTRLKIVEAMSYGVPVVASSKAVEGLPLLDGIHAAIGDTVVSLATWIARLCGSPDERARLVANAEGLVDTSFSAECQRLAVANALRELRRPA